MRTRFTKLIAVLAFLLAFPIAVLAQDDHSAKTYKGTLPAGAEKTFKIDAKKDQYINARITSERGNVMIAEEEGATELTAEVTGDGYDLVIRNQANRSEKYELKITVYTPEPEPPERIEFEKCEYKKTIALIMNPYKFKRRFVVRVQVADMSVTVTPLAARKRLKFRLVTNPSLDETWRADDASLLMFAEMAGDYVFEVEKTDEELLEAEMTVEIEKPC
jgi:hypothetical protein